MRTNSALLLTGVLAGGPALASPGSAPGTEPVPEAVETAAKLKVGDRAPGFPAALPSTAGERPGEKKIALSEVVGQKNIVLAFYVADWTGG